MDICLETVPGSPALCCNMVQVMWCLYESPLFMAELRGESLVGIARCQESVRSDLAISCALSATLWQANDSCVDRVVVDTERSDPLLACSMGQLGADTVAVIARHLPVELSAENLCIPTGGADIGCMTVVGGVSSGS